MHRLLLAKIGLLTFLCGGILFTNVFSQQPNTGLSAMEKPILVSDQFKFTEGPASDAQGNVFFTDQPNNRIWKYSTEGKLSIFLEPAGRSNGMYFDRLGNLITCADEDNQLWSVSPAGKITVLVSDWEGHRLNGPNDCWVDLDNGIFFTDPYYQRDYWQRQQPDSALGGHKLYYLPRGTNKPVVVATDFKKPNGLVGSKNGKQLFVSDIGAKIIYRYRVGKGGRLRERRVFVNHQSDGMTLDSKGNLYLAGKGVTIYNPKGIQIAHYPIPGWTANVCFGGVNNDTLFITASTAVYILPMKVKGTR